MQDKRRKVDICIHDSRMFASVAMPCAEHCRNEMVERLIRQVSNAEGLREIVDVQLADTAPSLKNADRHFARPTRRWSCEVPIGIHSYCYGVFHICCFVDVYRA